MTTESSSGVERVGQCEQSGQPFDQIQYIQGFCNKGVSNGKDGKDVAVVVRNLYKAECYVCSYWRLCGEGLGSSHLICPWRSLNSRRGKTTPGLEWTTTGIRQSRQAVVSHQSDSWGETEREREREWPNEEMHYKKIQNKSEPFSTLPLTRYCNLVLSKECSCLITMYLCSVLWN